MEHQVVHDFTDVNVSNENVKVYVRLRPPADGSEVSKTMFKPAGGSGVQKLTISDPDNKNYGEYAFMFDQAFFPEAGQDEIFHEVAKPLVDHALGGYNSCCFAYGQTGSGKTYSIFGLPEGEAMGITPRAVDYVFSALARQPPGKETAVVVSFLEMYCDQVRDLGKAYLDKGSRPGSASRQKTADWYQQRRSNMASGQGSSNDGAAGPCQIHEDTEGNVFVKGLSVIPVTTPEEVVTIIQMGLRLRATHETKMNTESSRSHTVFTLNIIQKDNDDEGGDTITGMINLVDLAGSERLGKSESEGQRLKEALNINSSLSALGKVVMALDPTGNASKHYIPYRDSKLTRLLQNSLGGNSYTAVLATVHPLHIHYEECLSTLHFANRCRNVRNQPRVNKLGGDGGLDKDKRIRKLVHEVAQLHKAFTGAQHSSKKRLQQLMAQLGIKGEVLPDGRFKTSTGEILGVADDGDASGSLAAGGGLAAARLRSDGAGGGGMMGGGSEAMRQLPLLQRELQGATVENGRLQARLRIAKQQEQDLKASSTRSEQTIRAQLLKAQKQLRDSTAELTEGQRRHSHEATEASDEHRHALDEMRTHNATLVKKHTDLVNKIPQSLTVDSRILSDAQNVEERVRDEGRVQLEGHVKQLERGQTLALENIKQQYDYWMDIKEKESASFINDFNKYYAYKAKQVAEYRDEMMLLLRYANRLELLVENMESGVYPLRIKGGTGIKRFVLPPQARPKDIFGDTELLKHVRGQVAMSGKALREVGLSNGTANGDTSSRRDTEEGSKRWQLASGEEGGRTGGAKGGGKLSAVGEGHGEEEEEHEGGGAAGSVSAQRVQEVGTGGNQAGGGGGGRGQELGQTAMGGDARGVFQPSLTLQTMSSGQLREEVGKLVQQLEQLEENRHTLRATLEEQVMNDLADHATVQYIKSLENERDTQKGQLSNEVQRNRQMRVSYNAQARLLTKLQQQLSDKRRPQSARAGYNPRAQRPNSAIGAHRPAAPGREQTGGGGGQGRPGAGSGAHGGWQQSGGNGGSQSAGPTGAVLKARLRRPQSAAPSRRSAAW